MIPTVIRTEISTKIMDVFQMNIESELEIDERREFALIMDSKVRLRMQCILCVC